MVGKILKFWLSLVDKKEVEINLPKDFQILKTSKMFNKKEERELPIIYVLTNNENEKEFITFKRLYTGEEFGEEMKDFQYFNSVILESEPTNPLVLHLLIKDSRIFMPIMIGDQVMSFPVDRDELKRRAEEALSEEETPQPKTMSDVLKEI